MSSILGIDFAPLQVPITRRLQTLAVIVHVMLFLAPPVMITLFLVVLATPFFWLALGYGAWIIYDVKVIRTSSRGGRRWEWLREHVVWQYFRDYFPAQLVKTSDLEPSKNYLIGYHPHGIIGCGAFCTFASEANNFSGLYPGIRPHLLTLKANFNYPLLRAVLLWMGVCDVSKESIRFLLSREGGGNAAVIVVGGAEEALNAQPGRYDVILQRRKGFVKQAIRLGASLVPSFGFGENDLFAQVDNPQGSRIRNFQTGFKNIFGFSPPFYYGRGVFNYNFGLLPHRKPVAIVVGRPIDVTKEENPSNETINTIHRRYIAELELLFDSHKARFGVDSATKLNLV